MLDLGAGWSNSLEAMREAGWAAAPYAPPLPAGSGTMRWTKESCSWYLAFSMHAPGHCEGSCTRVAEAAGISGEREVEDSGSTYGQP